jgi:hypothetical protein
VTRTEALLKLLALEPETRDQIIVITGWPAEETEAVLDHLVATGQIGRTLGGGGYGFGRRLYFTRKPHAVPDLPELGREANPAGDPQGAPRALRARPVLGVSSHARLVRTIRRGDAGRRAAAARMEGARAC